MSRGADLVVRDEELAIALEELDEHLHVLGGQRALDRRDGPERLAEALPTVESVRGGAVLERLLVRGHARRGSLDERENNVVTAQPAPALRLGLGRVPRADEPGLAERPPERLADQRRREPDGRRAAVVDRGGGREELAERDELAAGAQLGLYCRGGV
jgi:hypothetical protein